MDDEEPRDLKAEAAVLTDLEGRALLEQVAAVESPGAAALERWRREQSAERVAAAMRIVEARRRAVGKIANPEVLWLDRVGVEQATAEAVAVHKARRFAVMGWVWDLCCGLGMDAMALAKVAERVLAVEARQATCRRALWNARVSGLGDRVLVVRGLAERFRFGAGDWVHIDPDRRASGRGRERAARTDAIEAYSPGVDFLVGLIASGASGALKLGPASDFERHFGRRDDVEIELVSLHRECKEATVWFGAARSSSSRRRATALPSGASWASAGLSGTAAQPAGQAGAFVFDADPALVRSGLLDEFARAHGLMRLASGVDWLTADVWVESPFLQGFRVIDTLPMDERRLRGVVGALGGGTLDIRTRRLRRTPEQIRRSLRPAGGGRLTLFLHGGGAGEAGFAVVSEAVAASN